MANRDEQIRKDTVANLLCYILDHHEAEPLYEEQLQKIGVAFLKSKYNLLKEQPVEELDDWMAQATEFYASGGCPICFETDEAGHKEGCYIKEIEDKLDALLKEQPYDWIPVSERLPEEGNCLVLCEGKVYEVKVRISNDEWEDKNGRSYLELTARCDIEYLGCVLIGHDDCITHWKPIVLPEQPSKPEKKGG